MNTFTKTGMALAVILAIIWQLGCEPEIVDPYYPPTPQRPGATQAAKYFRANAGPDQTIAIPKTSVILDGSASEDTGRAVALYVWERVVSNGLNLHVSKALRTEVNGLEEGIYVYRLVATDKQGNSSADTMQVTVVDNFAVGTKPVISVGCDTLIRFEGESLHYLSASAHVDSADVQYYLTKGYTFTQLSGPSTATINYNYAPSAGWVTLRDMVRGNYTFKVDIDRKGARASDTIVMTLLADTSKGKTYIFETVWREHVDSFFTPLSALAADVKGLGGLLPGKTDRMLSVAYSDDGVTWTDVLQDEFFSNLVWYMDGCEQGITILRSVNNSAAFIGKKVMVRVKVVS